MRGVFDDLVFLMGTGVLGDQALFVINGHELLIGLEGEDHGGMGKRDAVAAGVEEDQRLGGALYGRDDAGVVIGFRQGDQKGLFFLPEEIDGSGFGGSMKAAVGGIVDPQGGLLIAIGQRAEGSAGEEVVFDVFYGIFDAPFFMGRSDIASRGVEQVMGREVQKAAVELDIGSYAGDDDAF